MKITIITVYNSYNYGSYLQARKLHHALSRYGETAFYQSHSRSMFRAFARKVKRIVKTGNGVMHVVRGAGFEFREWMMLRKCWRMLPNYDGAVCGDVVVLGSDEIWNISRKACRYPVYWGADTETYIAAYAPSIGQACTADFLDTPEYLQYLKKMNVISVRDGHSKRALEHFTKKAIAVVLDPTLLTDPDEEEFVSEQPYIAIYLFYGSISQEEKQAILDFARSRKLLLVSAGQYISWCDRCVHAKNGNPFYIYRNAKYVITNTFHGTAYAINYRTRFAVIAGGKKKVLDLLQQFELEGRSVVSPEGIGRVLDSPVDYKRVEDILSVRRKESYQFLEQVIEGRKHEDSGK